MFCGLDRKRFNLVWIHPAPEIFILRPGKSLRSDKYNSFVLGKFTLRPGKSLRSDKYNSFVSGKFTLRPGKSLRPDKYNSFVPAKFTLWPGKYNHSSSLKEL
ncbi:hypothetical protein SAMN05661012_00778 [Chitinophaga sancti]|uniref:Uncharacterized protein n=1 Tax=Chitinophaga sancti TaxID=1004 RepID=A0A1K1MQ54_9BACT|nr:hypothetical protein SAMN05661012_00778 [Chitinophaga sancti]